ncbi:MAG TPA: PIN domain-containing protein [Candidatus Acidoferrum sp.]|jgi:predicted nucleic acid-binding protein
MRGRFFLDTNIFVYTFDASAPAKASKATALVRGAIKTRIGVISYQVVQEFFNVAMRRFESPMSAAEADQYLAATFRPLLAVHSSPALFSEATRLGSKFQLSWYDSLIVAAAIEAQCDVLYSEDLQHDQRLESVTVTNPFAADAA